VTLVDEARKLIGTPWQHQARSAAAVDCLGLLVLAERATGRVVADRTNYGRVPTRAELEAGLIAHYGPPVLSERPALADLRPGDKLLILLPGAPGANHVGIVGDSPNGLTLIHAWSGGECRVTEHRIDHKWQRRIVAVFRGES
jgi:cell wall-associated NlpC family hydrolase